MWWNFIGRSHDEVAGYREAWAAPGPAVPAGRRPRREGDGGAADADGGAQAPAAPGGAAGMNPVDALREIGFLLERSRADTYRVRAYRGAADVVERMSETERAEHPASGPGTRCPASDRRPRP